MHVIVASGTRTCLLSPRLEAVAPSIEFCTPSRYSSPKTKHSGRSAQSVHLRTTHQYHAVEGDPLADNLKHAQDDLNMDHSLFAKLPRELRNQIWNETFAVPGPIDISFREGEVTESTTNNAGRVIQF
jgi:hypothetical protein